MVGLARIRGKQVDTLPDAIPGAVQHPRSAVEELSLHRARTGSADRLE